MANKFPPYWYIKSPNQAADLVELSKILLQNRGVGSEKDFWYPQDPLKISLNQVGLDQKKVAASVDRLLEARKKQEKIVIFGDYDADGICGTAIVWQTLHAVGFQVTPFIPDRKKHGYGLSRASIDDLLAESKPNLILTVDNGIVANQEVGWLRKEGLDVILTDHHQPGLNKQAEPDLPKTPYLVHSPWLCGATVAWMLMRELVSTAKLDIKLITQQLDLAAIATIADQVPLQKENRSFAWHGLKQLELTQRVGLLALFEQAGQDQSRINGENIGYVIAPRINAMGRMAHGMDALRLLCTNNLKRAKLLAQNLDKTNQTRKDLTSELVDQAVQLAKKQRSQKLIFIFGKEYHQGVIGLVAGRLVEIFHRPTVVVGTEGALAKASARSIEGVNITDLIRRVEDQLLSVGGHPMAAGFSAELGKVEQIGETLQSLANNLIEDELLVKKIEVDCLLPPELLSVSLGELIEKMEPFGTNNPKPLFVLPDMKIEEVTALGRDKRHLKLMLSSSKLKKPIKALWWGKGDRIGEFLNGSLVNCLTEVTLNRWNGRVSVELRLKTILASFKHVVQ